MDGIASLGLALAPFTMDVGELAALRGTDPAKSRVGLGCNRFGVCPPEMSAADLGVRAAQRALARWGGPIDRIGLIAVGTETAKDMSRPLSAWIADALGLRGAIRSYEVKHACYGGTLALRQALEWRRSGAARGQAALVVATDIARYAPSSPAEPTMGAGAVAFVIDDARVAEVDLDSHAWSSPAFDFWRPVGEAYPSVDGPLSLDCYKEGAVETFRALTGGHAEALADFDALAFHVPFPKMVRKAVAAVAASLGLDEPSAEALWADKVLPTMRWNQETGNAYTASLWIAVAHALRGADAGSRVAAYSYGSGFGAELLTLTAGPDAAVGAWADDVEQDLAQAVPLDGAAWTALRAAET